MCLIREPGADGFLARLDRAFAAKLPKVPHVLVTPADAAKHPKAALPLLHALHGKLRSGQFGRNSFKQFDHYELADHLSGVELTPKQVKYERPVEAVLRAWGRHRMSGQVGELADKAGERAQFLMALTKFAGRFIGLYWRRDRVPGLGRERRWFMRQPYMVPRHSQDFFDFAERLTKDRRESENLDQFHKLLVHAFLEDLRTAYRRTRAGFVPHRKAHRRTTYVPVLLDDVDPAGWELLRLVNEVRNETGELDPLLFITAGGEQPDDLAAPSTPMTPNVAEEAFSAWKGRLPRRRQLLAPDARYLFVSLPAAVPDGVHLSGRDRHAWEIEEREGPRRAVWPARRGVGEMLVVLVVLAAAAVPAKALWTHWWADCAFFGAVTGNIATEVVTVDGTDQCVGYSDNAGQVFGRNERLRLAQENVFAQNEVAADLHEQSPDRPYFSLVYFAGLTFNQSFPASEHSVAEELEGLLIRQRQLNTQGLRSGPLLRIVIANGGNKMAVAHAVARDLLVPLIEADPGILGVVGFDRSVTQTAAAITELGDHGVTAVGTTLTRVGLDGTSPLYFQLVPDNTVQANLIADYAADVQATKVTIFHRAGSGPDAYVDSLVEVMRARLGGGPIEVVDKDWQESAAELSKACIDQEDRHLEIAFHAGREDEFGGFLQALRNNCAGLDKLPRVVASDAVSRFVAHTPGRNRDEFNGVPLFYVGMGGLVVLAGRSCVEGRSGTVVGGSSALDSFCAGYHALRDEISAVLPAVERPVAPWPGERVGGLYDTAGLFAAAVQELRPQGGPAPHRAAVAQRFREMDFQGATGLINFKQGRIANDRNLAVLKLADIHDVQGIPECELMTGFLYRRGQERDPVTGCPALGVG
ncbi:ABC transporter substrate-binding protein [Actinosynnema sp. NPDC023658]|uniref:ABC transporter substrate-binding protein n=1 Tax=Actinosynnema sp. NPDC023658 TaxID=3155465 RepID=UPI0033EE3710